MILLLLRRSCTYRPKQARSRNDVDARLIDEKLKERSIKEMEELSLLDMEKESS